MKNREQSYAATVLGAFGGTRAFGIVPDETLDREALSAAFQRLGCEIAWCAGYARVTHSLPAPLHSDIATWSKGLITGDAGANGRREAWSATRSLVNRVVSSETAINQTPRRRSVA